MTEAEKKKYLNKKYGRITGRKVYRGYKKATKKLEKKCQSEEFRKEVCDSILADIFKTKLNRN